MHFRNSDNGGIPDPQSILIASDFDGTLCPIANRPEDVRVAPQMLDVLTRLAVREGTVLAVITGRSLADISTHLPLNAVFAGNHGLEIQGYGVHFEHPRGSLLRPELDEICARMGEVIEPWPGAWVENKGLTATIHFRNVECGYQDALVDSVTTEAMRFNSRFRVRAGKKALEICPKVDFNKGTALNFIKEKFGPFKECICLGDDQTDEDMFQANSSPWNFKVGPGASAAQFRLTDVQSVEAFLSAFTVAGCTTAHLLSPEAIRLY